MKTPETSVSNQERAAITHLPIRARVFVIRVMLTAIILFAHALYEEAQAEIPAGRGTELKSTQEMILIPGGEFLMGNEGAYADEMPRHAVRMNAFYLDAHEVTNSRFAKFVNATGYLTQAERDGQCWAYFDGNTDWKYAAGTDWRHPQGPMSTIEDKMNHPVVCVSWEDAAAYARWAGKRLPTEAEWEYASRTNSPGHFVANTASSGHARSQHAGDAHMLAATDRSPSSKSHTDAIHIQKDGLHDRMTVIEANVWQGHWPDHNTLGDGFLYTSPAASFPANDWGVYDMLGNVWEWTADWYDSSYYADSPASNPQGPETGQNRVARGGSWFCSPNYCGAYSTHYRGASPPDHAFNNVGFRCAMDVSEERK